MRRTQVKYVRLLAGILGIAILAIQFIRPARNLQASPAGVAVESRFPVPANVMQILRRSCYDCHSDSTVYPWYAEIQPVGWWLNSHIEDGKRGINFNRFGSYRLMRQYGKFRDIVEQLREDKMPLGSYLFIHRYARLSSEEKEEVIRWSGAMMDSMRAHYPADSLQRKRTEGRGPG
jgi:hypothetical protein